MCSLHQHDLRKHCFVAERVLEIVMSGRGNPMKGQALWMTLGLTLRKKSLGRSSDEKQIFWSRVPECESDLEVRHSSKQHICQSTWMSLIAFCLNARVSCMAYPLFWCWDMASFSDPPCSFYVTVIWMPLIWVIFEVEWLLFEVCLALYSAVSPLQINDARKLVPKHRFLKIFPWYAFMISKQGLWLAFLLSLFALSTSSLLSESSFLAKVLAWLPSGSWSCCRQLKSDLRKGNWMKRSDSYGLIWTDMDRCVQVSSIRATWTGSCKASFWFRSVSVSRRVPWTDRTTYGRSMTYFWLAMPVSSWSLTVSVRRRHPSEKSRPACNCYASSDWAVFSFAFDLIDLPFLIWLTQVKTASKKLTALLPAIHPLDQCRQRFVRGSRIICQIRLDQHFETHRSLRVEGRYFGWNHWLTFCQPGRSTWKQFLSHSLFHFWSRV